MIRQQKPKMRLHRTTQWKHTRANPPTQQKITTYSKGGVPVLCAWWPKYVTATAADVKGMADSSTAVTPVLLGSALPSLLLLLLLPASCMGSAPDSSDCTITGSHIISPRLAMSAATQQRPGQQLA
jgi:hypothetical protein